MSVTTDNPIVEMKRITKRFGSLVANNAVDFFIKPGNIHALVGENGAGKTTLMNVLYGALIPEEGEIYLNGKKIQFRSPKDALKNGIGMVTQHYAVIPELTVLDNLILGDEPSTFSYIQRKQAVEKADALALKMGFSFNWHAYAETLSPASTQKLEILKLLWRDADILILDEPTAMLSPQDAESLFENLTKLTKNAVDGKKRAVVFVTHKLNEVMQYADWVTVLRGGVKAAESLVSETNPKQLTQCIIGEELQANSQIQETLGNQTVLTVENLTILGDLRNTAISDVSFMVNQGEILGVAGVDGNGQSELVECLVGLRNATAGVVQLSKKDITRHSVYVRINLGLRYLPDDRKRRAIIESWPLIWNAILGFHRQIAGKLGVISPNKAILKSERLIKNFEIRAENVWAPLSSLSGGNQQRLAAARTLDGDPQMLIAFQPTRGLDFRGVEKVYSEIRRLGAQGLASVVLSFDLDELLTYCDTIAVLYRGKLLGPYKKSEITREEIGRLMVGGNLS